MSTVTVLNKIKEFLEEKVTPSIELQKSNDSNIDSYELMHPNVFVGWVPPNGFLPPGMERAIPCLVVGMDDATDDSTTDEIAIRITGAVYSPGLHKPKIEGEGNEFIPDMQGYVDLLNLLDRTVAELAKNKIIKNTATLQDPIKRGMYLEQPYPYWYSWITFTVSKAAYPRSEILKNL